MTHLEPRSRALSAMRLANASSSYNDWEDLLNSKVTPNRGPFPAVAAPTPAAKASPSHPYPPSRPHAAASSGPLRPYLYSTRQHWQSRPFFITSCSPQYHRKWGQLDVIKFTGHHGQLNTADWSQLCGIARAYGVGLKPKQKGDGQIHLDNFVGTSDKIRFASGPRRYLLGHGSSN